MKNQLSEEKLDLLIKTIIDESQLDQAVADEIADSPQLWWAVQRNVVGQDPAPRRGWLPTFDWRIVAFGAMLLIGFAGLVAVNRSADGLNLAATPESHVFNAGQVPVARSVESPAANAVPAKAPVRTAVRRDAVPNREIARRSPEPKRRDTASVEVKSEFIALMYSPDYDSGQIVKVKVPRSMMVSLGVSTNVQNSSEFVNAEVLMGDDGSARAIRFIQ